MLGTWPHLLVYKNKGNNREHDVAGISVIHMTYSNLAITLTLPSFYLILSQLILSQLVNGLAVAVLAVMAVLECDLLFSSPM